MTARFVLSLCSPLLSLLGWMRINECLLDEFWTSLYSQEGQNTICQVVQPLQSPKKENSDSFPIVDIGTPVFSTVTLRLWKTRSTEYGKLVDRIVLSLISSFPKVIIFLAFCSISALFFYFLSKWPKTLK